MTDLITTPNAGPVDLDAVAVDAARAAGTTVAIATDADAVITLGLIPSDGPDTPITRPIPAGSLASASRPKLIGHSANQAESHTSILADHKFIHFAANTLSQHTRLTVTVSRCGVNVNGSMLALSIVVTALATVCVWSAVRVAVLTGLLASVIWTSFTICAALLIVAQLIGNRTTD